MLRTQPRQDRDKWLPSLGPAPPHHIRRESVARRRGSVCAPTKPQNGSRIWVTAGHKHICNGRKGGSAGAGRAGHPHWGPWQNACCQLAIKSRVRVSPPSRTHHDPSPGVHALHPKAPPLCTHRTSHPCLHTATWPLFPCSFETGPHGPPIVLTRCPCGGREAGKSGATESMPAS